MRDRNPIAIRYLPNDDSTRLYRDNPQLGRSPETYCPTCSKEGRYYWKGSWHNCNCEEQLQLHKWYLVSGIGVTYQRLSWDDFEGDPVLRQTCDKYLSRHVNYVERGIGLMLHGTVGTGKTFAGMMLLKELVKLGYRCYATTFSSMIEMFTAGWYSPADKRYFQDQIVLSNVLFLDDIGKELRTKSNLSESTFDHVLRQRVQSGRPTFITTNLTQREMSEGYGKSILSLLREVSIKYDVQGDDYRPRANRRMMAEVSEGEFRPIQ